MNFVLKFIPVEYRLLALAVAVAVLCAASASGAWWLRGTIADAEVASVRAQWDAEKLSQAQAALNQTNEARAKEADDAKKRDAVEKNYQLATAKTHALASELRAMAARVGGLRDPGTRPNCTSLPGATQAAGIPANAAASTGDRLSGAATDFLLGEAERADEVATYASACHEWAMTLGK